jgi:DNA-binding response OmpR family regulator
METAIELLRTLGEACKILQPIVWFSQLQCVGFGALYFPCRCEFYARTRKASRKARCRARGFSFPTTANPFKGPCKCDSHGEALRSAQEVCFLPPPIYSVFSSANLEPANPSIVMLQPFLHEAYHRSRQEFRVPISNPLNYLSSLAGSPLERQPGMRTSADIANLLVVSRDLGVLRSISTVKASNCWRFETASNAWEAMERVRAGASPRVLLLDLHESEADCIDMLRWMRRIRPALPVIMIGHTGDVNGQEESTRLGAKAYLTRPLDERQLATVIESSLTAEAEASEVVENRSTPTLAPRSDAPGLPLSLSDATDPGAKSLRALLKSVRTEAERNAIAVALEKTGGNRKAAARLLNVSYRTVLYKIEEYKMTPPSSSQQLKADGARNVVRGIRDDTGSAEPEGKPLMDRRKELQ